MLLAAATQPIVNVQVNNPAADTTSRDTQSETTVLAFGGNTVLAAFNDSGSNALDSSKFTGFARSTDGGQTFTDGGLLPTNINGDAGDPVLARDKVSGAIYLATLSMGAKNVIQVFKSLDGGATFGPPVNADPGRSGASLDKEWLAVDNFAGPGQGNVYQITRDFGSSPGIYFTRSTDGGATFGPSGGTAITTAGGVQGAWVTVGADHSVYAFWYDGTATAAQKLMMRKSTDQGATFGAPVVVASLATTGTNGDFGLGFRTNAFPQAVASPSNPNWLYVAYADRGASGDRCDIYLTRSTDGGATWSAPLRVNDDGTTRDQWQPALAISPGGNQLFVGFYDRRNDAANSLIDTYGAIADVSASTGAPSFRPNFKITTASFAPVYGVDPAINSVYMGDYDGAVADGSYFYYTWGDNRDASAARSGKQANVRMAKIATGMTVVNTTPATDATLSAAPPTDFVVQLSDAYDPATVQAGDLTVNGSAADAVTLTDATTLTFHFVNSPVTAEGPQTIALADGAIAELDNALALTGFTTSFYYDPTPMAVTATSPASGDNITLPLTTLDVTFSEPYAASSIAKTNLQLSQGAVTGFTLTSPTTVRYTLSGLNTEATLTFGIVGVTDAAGVPMTPFPSGTFTTDIGTVPFPGAPLADRLPQGSTVYDGTATAVIGSGGDSDAYTLSLDAGQTLTLVVKATGAPAALQPVVQLVDPLGNVLGTATATTAGGAALLQSVPITAAGNYTFTISGAGASAGAYSIEATLNAAQEAENYGGPTNDTTATAQSLDASLLGLGGAAATAQRVGVLGTTGAPSGATTLLSNDAESGLAGFTIDNTGAGLWHLSTGRGSQAGHSATHSFYFGQNEGPGGGGNYSTGSRTSGSLISPSVVLPAGSSYQLDFNYLLQTEGSTAWDLSQLQVSTNGGTSWTTVASYNGTGETGGNWKAAPSVSLSGYAGQTIKLRWFFDTLDGAANAYEGWYVDDIRLSQLLPSNDYYSVTLNAGDSITVGSKALNGASGAVDVRLLSPGGTPAALSSGGASNLDRVITDFVAPATGTYYLLVTGSTGAPYSLILTRNAEFDTESNDTTGSAQAIRSTPLNGDQRVLGNMGGTSFSPLNLAALRGQSIAGQSVGGVRFDFSVGGAASADATVEANDEPALYLDDTVIRGDATGTMTLTFDRATSSLRFALGFTPGEDGTGNDQPPPGGEDDDSPTAFVELYDASGNLIRNVSLETLSLHGGPLSENEFAYDGAAPVARAIIHFDQPDGDFLLSGLSVASGNTVDTYAVNLTAGKELKVSTATPGDGPGEYVNTFNPRVRILNSSGAQVAIDDNSDPDGRNARLSYIPTTGGVYYIEVSSTTSSSTFGDYILDLQGAAPAATTAFTVTGTTLAARMKSAPTAVTLTFSASVSGASLTPGSLTVDGIPATAVTLATANTATFTLAGPLADGTHTLAIAAGAVTNLQGVAVTAYSTTFTIDSTAPRVVASSIQEGAIANPGSLTYSVTFNEPMLTSNLDSSDFSLRGLIKNVTYSPASYSYNAGGTVLTISYANLPEDNYTLTLLSGDGRFEDLTGSDLDGEPVWPLPTIGSGDGTAGGNFFVDFTADVGAMPFPTPLTGRLPLGGLAYDGTFVGTISAAGDTDSFTLSADPQQQLTVVLSGAGATLRAQVDVLDAANNVIASATAASAGQDVVIQGLALPGTGSDTYTIRISGAGGTVGAYTLQPILNAVVENEEHNGPTNDTRATAHSLDAAFTSLGNSASRAMVIGRLPATSGSADWYSFSLSAGDSATIAAIRAAGAGAENMSFYDAGGTLLANGMTGGPNYDYQVNDFHAAATGTYYVLVSGPGTSGVTPYNLLVTRNASFDAEYNSQPSQGKLVQSTPSADGTQTVLGHIDSGDLDYYKVSLAPGATLSLATRTPGDGSGEPGNMLDPRLRLLDSNGQQVAIDDNSAPDLRSASLGYTSAAGGTYLIEVGSTKSGAAGQGDYVLTIGGASAAAIATAEPFSVIDTTLGTASKYKTVPATVTLFFNDTLLLTSLNPADVTLDGIPATAVAPGQNANSAVFTMPTGVTADGPHTLAVVSGSITDVQGTLVQPFSTTFTLDTIGPRVIASSIQEGGTVPTGALTYTVTFNEPMNRSNLDSSDVTLKGVLKNVTYLPLSVSYNTDGTVLTVTYSNLPDDQYQLTLLSGGTGRFQDALGNDLDGEPVWPMPPNQSGDGTPGGNFLVNFAADQGTAPYPTPLTAKLPQGSLIYDPQAGGAITSTTDTDSYTLDVHAGQTITILTHPTTAGLQPTVTLIDGTGAVLATAKASSPGQDSVIQTITAAATGTYTVTIGGDGGTTGYYTTQVILNAAQELEGHGGPANDSIATAQNIDPSFISLGGSASRGAVVGATDSSSPADFYAVTLTAGQPTTFAVTSNPSGGAFSLALVDAFGNTLATGAASAATNVGVLIRDFIPQAGGTYYLKIVGLGTSVPGYSLLVTRGAGFDLEANDSRTTAQDLDPSGGTVLGLITSTNDDWYRFSASAGDNVTIATATPGGPAGAFINSLNPRIELYAPDGTLAASDDNSAPDGRNALVRFAAPISGYYWVRVTNSLSTGGEYVLSVTGNAPPPVPGAPDLLGASDSGISSTDNLTKFNSATSDRVLQFSVPGTIAGATVTLYANGVAVGSAVATGTTTVVATTAGSKLNDGTYSFTARITPPGGGSEGPDSPALSVTIDTLTPLAPTAAPDLQSASDSGASSTDNITNVTRPTFSIGGSTNFRVYRDGVQISQDYQSGSTYIVPTALADGTYNFAISAVDLADNESPLSAALPVTILTAAPAAPTQAPHLQAASDSGVSSTDNITNVKAMTFDVNVGTTPYFRFLRDGGLISGTYETGNSYTTAPQADGTGNYSVQAVDAAGNVSSASPLTPVTVDTQPYHLSGTAGTFDTTFGVNGILTTTVSRTPSHTSAMAIGPDGKIVAAGGNGDFTLARYLAGGSLDTYFGGSGIINTNVISDDDADAVVVQPDGKIIAAGQAGDPTKPIGISWVRYNPNGTLDPDFGVGGRALGVAPGMEYLHGAMLLQPDGKLLTSAAGFNGTALSFETVRMNPNGSLDTTFGNGGIVFTNFGGNGDFPWAIARQPDGKIVVAGYHSDAASGVHFVALARYTAEGAPDASFGTAGVVKTAVNGLDEAYDLAIQPDGRIVVVGRTTPAGATLSRKLILRYMPDGSLDPTFAQNGVFVGNPIPSLNDSATSVALQPDGRIVIGEWSGFNNQTNLASLARFTANGSPDGTFGNAGTMPIPNGGQIERVAILPTGKILAIGSPVSATPKEMLYRVNAAGPSDLSVNLQPSSDTGVSSADRITSAASPVFDITHPDPYFRVYRDGVLVSGSYETGATYTAAAPAADGTYSYSMTTVDVAGNESVVSSPQLITFDTTPPAAQISPVSGGPAPVDAVTITFSEPVYGLTLANLSLTLNGDATTNLLTTSQTLTPSADHRTWTLANLAGITTATGQYRLALAPSAGLMDVAGNGLAAPADTTWNMTAMNASLAGVMYLRIDDDGVNVDVWQNAAQPGQGTPTRKIALADLPGLFVTGGAGDDTLVLDLSHGNPLSGGGNVTFTGGGGNDTIAFVGTAGDDTITATASGVTFASSIGGFAPLSVSLSGIHGLLMHGGSGGNDTINITGGAFALDADNAPGTSAANVSVSVGSGSTVTFDGADQRLANLTISGNGVARAIGATGTVLSTGALSITGAGVLDLGKGSLTVDNTLTPAAMVQQYLHNAYNADPATGIGNWLGTGGITSSEAIASHNGATPDFRVSVGYVNGADAADPLINGSIPGQETLPASNIVIRPVLYGDLNLDGQVDDTDLSIFSGLGQYNQPAAKFGWLGGDLNYDGKVDDTDLQIFSGAGNYNGPAYPPATPAPTAASTVAAPAALAAGATDQVVNTMQAPTPIARASSQTTMTSAPPALPATTAARTAPANPPTARAVAAARRQRRPSAAVAPFSIKPIAPSAPAANSPVDGLISRQKDSNLLA